MASAPANLNNEIWSATMRETRATLARWNQTPFKVIGSWFALSFAIAALMLVAVYVMSLNTTPEATSAIPNVYGKSHLADVWLVFRRNMLVLALHAFVCLAGFMAMRALPEQTQYKSGINRWVHEHASPFAMVFVSVATIFSICTQIYYLGHQVADLAFTFGISQSTLMYTVLPHALVELTAVFLPLAAFLIASRRGDWHELLAATIVTVAIATPMIVIAGFLEAYLWPMTLRDVLGG